MIVISSASYRRELKGDKDISEFQSLREAKMYGYFEQDWSWYRLETLGIELKGTLLKSKPLTKKQIKYENCEPIGMGVYLNHELKKVYQFYDYSNDQMYYKEFKNYTW